MISQRFVVTLSLCFLLGACSSERTRIILGGGLAAGMAMEEAEELRANGATFDDVLESSELGYVVRAHGGLQMSRGWAAIVELEYTDVTFDLNGQEVDGTAVSTFGSLRYTLEIDTPIRPYAKVGAGFAKSLEGEEESSFGVKGALGLQFDLADSLSLYGEAQYVEYFSPDYSITGIGVDSESITYGVHVGVEARL